MRRMQVDTSNTFNKFFTPIISINRNHNTLPSKDDAAPRYNWVDARLLAEKIFRNYLILTQITLL